MPTLKKYGTLQIRSSKEQKKPAKRNTSISLSAWKAFHRVPTKQVFDGATRLEALALVDKRPERE